jgi:hypothetical protein
VVVKPGMRLHRNDPSAPDPFGTAMRTRTASAAALVAALQIPLFFGLGAWLQPRLVEPLAAAAAVTALVAAWCVWRIRRQRAHVEVWTDEERVVVRIPGVSTLEIARRDIIAVERTPHHLVLHGRTPRERVGFPATVEDFEELAQRLQTWAPARAHNPREWRIPAWPLALGVTAAPLMVTVILGRSPWAEAAAATMVAVLVGLAVKLWRLPVGRPLLGYAVFTVLAAAAVVVWLATP